METLDELLRVLKELAEDEHNSSALKWNYGIDLFDPEDDSPLTEAVRAWLEAGYPGAPPNKERDTS